MSVISLPLQNCWFYDVEAKLQHQIYSAFGKLIGVEDGSGNDIASAPELDPFFAFTGREYDEETGLYYYRARYYSPSLGRFLQVDPHPGELESPITFNSKYIYAHNNPTNLVDPTGKWSVGHIIALAVVGVLAITNEIVYADDKEKRNKNRKWLAAAAIIIATNGQYGWQKTLIAVGYSAAMSSIQADTKGGGDFEDYFWMNLGMSFAINYGVDYMYATDTFFAPPFYALGTMYGMGSSYEKCRKRYQDKWSDGKVQGLFCAGVVYGGGIFGEP